MIVVTGGAGFIGSAIVWKLNLKGIDDILIVDNLGRTEKWKNLVNLSYKDYIHKSVFTEKLLNNKIENIEAIIHMGACSSTTENDADYLMENNFHYSKTLAEYALKNDIRFINASSAATYGDGECGFSDNINNIENLKPLNMYGYSKQLFDLWALDTGAVDKLASVKFFNVFGPNEYHKDDMRSVIVKAFYQVREAGCIRLFKSYRPEYPDGGQRRDFIYIKDCVEVISRMLENHGINGIYNIGTGKARTWNALAKAVFAAMGVKENIEYIEMPEQLQDRYQYFTQAEMQKLSDEGCNIIYTSLEDSIDDYIKSYLQQNDIYL
ncbi:MAG: ADP-glyceromanno-heptose 6-epimerase [Desulfobacterales bacterium]|nr:ADP-glyceromanno-heptose 6-epimerase [Desulfobacterales bacterium]